MENDSPAAVSDIGTCQSTMKDKQEVENTESEVSEKSHSVFIKSLADISKFCYAGLCSVTLKTLFDSNENV